MQDHLLAAPRDPSLRVFVIWYAMYQGDARSKWRPTVIADPRVEHWWDERRLLGRQILSDLQPYNRLRAAGSREFEEEILWDAYLLFDRTARWDESPTGLVGWGSPVMATREALRRETLAVLKAPSTESDR